MTCRKASAVLANGSGGLKWLFLSLFLPFAAHNHNGDEGQAEKGCDDLHNVLRRH